MFIIYKGDEDNQESDKEFGDGNDRKNEETEKSAEDIWSTDFVVSEKISFSFLIKVMFVLCFNYNV